MMMKTMRLTLLAAAAVALAGCASKPDPNSFGGRLSLEGGEVAKIGDSWNAAQAEAAEGRELIEDGEDQIRKGEKLISRGEDNVDDGRANIRRGERMVADGERKALAAEKLYQTRTATQGLPQPVLTN